MLKRLFRHSASATSSAPEIDVAGTAAVRTTGGAQIVDVREPEGWADSHIPGAVHIPLGALAARVSELDASQAVIAVCRSGQRSLTAADMLLAAGFTDAKSMAGGMIEWADAGHPVERR